MKLAFPTKLMMNPAQALAKLKRAQPYVVGIVLVSLFGYTAYVVNTALNVTPDTAANTAKPITFDRPTLNSLKRLDVVSGQLPSGEVGKDNPFTR